MENLKEKELVIFASEDGKISFDVNLENETVWLTQKQMAELFDTSRENITMHLNNVYSEEELSKNSTSKDFLLVRNEGKRQVKRSLEHYNLDAIISVGYRINSRRGTQFRIWATKVLKDHLIQGYTKNEKRLAETKRVLEITNAVLKNKTLNTDEAVGLLNVITDYSQALDLLDQYDHQELKIQDGQKSEEPSITYEEAKEAIESLKIQLGIAKHDPLFGNEKDNSFKSAIGAIYQTFDGQELYSTIEEKASNFLYFMIKNHAFSDGNKRIAAFLFVWFLNKHRILYRSERQKRIENNTLVSICLMIAESHPKDKEVMVTLVFNLLMME